MFARITDTRNQHLANVRVQIDADGTMSITRIEGSQAGVFVYYFHRGRRDIFVDLGEVKLRGVLRTRMDGTARKWWVVPNCPAAEIGAIASTARESRSA